MTSSQVRFAILGFGHHAVRRLLPAFSKCSGDAERMWRRDQMAAQQNCAEYKIPHCFPTREALCSSPEVDVVLITSRMRCIGTMHCWHCGMARQFCARSRRR